MPDETQRLALVRALAPRIATLELDALRLVDHVVTRLELGRARYGELDLSAPRDWSRELGEELVDALVYQAARELAAQDMARESLREAARAEMVGVERPMFERLRVHYEHPGHNGVADLGPATEFATDAHRTRVSTEPAQIAASHEAGGEPYEELEVEDVGPHSCVLHGVDDHDECALCGRVYGGEAG